jgi:2-iminobutanoate/2-iminopropanoate deaminase
LIDQPRRLVLAGGSTMGGREPLIADATEWNGTLYLSGRADVDPATLRVRSTDFTQQAKSVLRDIFRVLDESRSSPAHVLRVESYLARPADFEAWNVVFAESFPRPRPARTTILAGFPVPGLLVEIQVTAAVAP